MAENKYNQQSEAKYNAGLDAEKRIMDLLKEIDRISLIRTGEAQQGKYILMKQLTIATRGMFNKPTIRDELWNYLKQIQLQKQRITIKEGKVKEVVVYHPEVDAQLDNLLIKITDNLQDDRGFFSPSKGDLSLF